MFEKIIEMINSAGIIGLFAHINPDGDALGSMYSLKNVLHSICLLYTSPSPRD